MKRPNELKKHAHTTDATDAIHSPSAVPTSRFAGFSRSELHAGPAQDTAERDKSNSHARSDSVR